MTWTSYVISPPTTEPITLREAREHLRNNYECDDFSEEDYWLEAQIPAAREFCEAIIGRSIAPQVREWASDCFPCRIVLPYGPVTAIESISYYDLDGAAQTFSAYITYDGEIVRNPGVEWPATRVQPGAVRVRYTAGYGSVGDSPATIPLPKSIKAAMLLVLGSRYDLREDATAMKIETIPEGVLNILEPYRRRLSMA